jgi:hypothetical protein
LDTIFNKTTLESTAFYHNNFYKEIFLKFFVLSVQEILDKRTVDTKQENYALYFAGALGNRALAWSSLDELMKSEWRGRVCIRGKSGINRGKVKYNVPFFRLNDEISNFQNQGISLGELTFNQLMPDESLIIQGEVTRGLRGLELTYSHVKKPMNIALRENELFAFGLKADLILKEMLWPESYAEVIDLLDFFPGKNIWDYSHTVEFSSYDRSVGDLPHRNTVIWECRNY